MANTSTALVIEDDETWQSILKETLENEGYNVIVLTNYRQSRQALDNYTFDFVILDLELDESAPMLDGERLMQQLFQHHPDAPCIIVSGQGDVNVVRNAFKEYRVADFISKNQFNISNFVHAVQDALSQHRVARDQASIERRDDPAGLASLLKIDTPTPKPEASSSEMGGQALPLSPIPELKSQLLQILVERFSEEELHTLCFHLDVDDQKWGNKGKEAKARELIYYLIRRQSLLKLLQVGQHMRPDIPWRDMS